MNINRQLTISSHSVFNITLTKLQHFFRHGSEPAVKLTYSDKSSTSATISLGVADEVTRDGYHPGMQFFLI